MLRAGCAAIVNATPVAWNREWLPVNLAELDSGALVLDLVYNRMGERAFAEQARAMGHQVVDGRLVLLAQTLRQYYLLTGATMTESLGRRLLSLPAATARNGASSRYQDRSNVRLPFSNLGKGSIHAA